MRCVLLIFALCLASVLGTWHFQLPKPRTRARAVAYAKSAVLSKYKKTGIGGASADIDLSAAEKIKAALPISLDAREHRLRTASRVADDLEKLRES